MKRRLLVNTIALGLTQLVNYVVPFLVLIHLTNILGLHIYGILAFSQGIVSLSFVFLDLGYGLSATNKISKNRNSKKYISKLIGNILLIKLLLFFICASFIIFFIEKTEKYSEYSMVFWVSMGTILIQGLIPSWFFHGLEKIKFISLTSVIAKIIFSFATLSLVKVEADYILVPIFYSLEQFAVLLISVFYMYKLGYRVSKPSFRFLFYSFKFTQHFFASRLAVAAYMNGGVVILGLAASPAVVAIYSMAEQFYKAMQSALAPAAIASYPYMSKERDSSLIFWLIGVVVSISIVGSIFGYFMAPLILRFLFEESWLEAIPVLNIFFIAIIIHASAIMMGYPMAAIVNRLDVANLSVIIGAIVYGALLIICLVMNLITPIYLAVMMVISETIVVLYRGVILIPLVVKMNYSNRRNS